MSATSEKSDERTQTAPDLPIGRLEAEDLLKILDRGGKRVFGAQYARYGHHCRDRVCIEGESALIRRGCALEFAHDLGQTSCRCISLVCQARQVRDISYPTGAICSHFGTTSTAKQSCSQEAPWEHGHWAVVVAHSDGEGAPARWATPG